MISPFLVNSQSSRIGMVISAGGGGFLPMATVPATGVCGLGFPNFVPSLYLLPDAVTTTLPSVMEKGLVLSLDVLRTSPTSISGMGLTVTVPVTPPLELMLQSSRVGKGSPTIWRVVAEVEVEVEVEVEAVVLLGPTLVDHGDEALVKEDLVVVGVNDPDVKAAAALQVLRFK